MDYSMNTVNVGDVWIAKINNKIQATVIYIDGVYISIKVTSIMGYYHDHLTVSELITDFEPPKNTKAIA